MTQTNKVVDGFRFLPPKLSAWIQTYIPGSFSGAIPFHQLYKPLEDTRLALVTTAGISLKTDDPFDMEREKQEPTWGDPTFREIPKGTTGDDIEIRHLHINTSYIQNDINVMLPLDRLEEFVNEGVVGELAPTSYSFYGYQWEGLDFIDQGIAPMTERMKQEGVEAALLTPA